MKNTLLYFAIVFYLFITDSIANKIGIDHVGITSSFLLILLSIYCIAGYSIDHKVKLNSVFTEEFLIIFLGIIIASIKIIIGEDFSSIRMIFFLLIVPMLVSILLGTKNRLTRRHVTYIIVVFFIAECSLAIFERLFYINIFPYEEAINNNVQAWQFRSSSLLGHPLNNTVCVSIMMGFILTTSYSYRNKILFFLLGYSSLICFNSRGAILLWTIVLVIFLVYSILKMSINKSIISAFIALGLLVLLLILSNTSNIIGSYELGGRLFHQDLIDGSTMARVSALEALLYVDNLDLWIGNSENYILITNKLGAGGIENSYVDIIIRYGVIMSILLFITYYLWIKKLLSSYTFLKKLLIITAFIGVGSMNNSLASSTPWAFFVICANTFPFLTKKRENSY